MKQYYDTLGVTENCSQDDLKKAYRKLAKEHHPDAGGDGEKFKEVTEAYEILTGKRKPPRQEPNFQDIPGFDESRMREIFEKMQREGNFGPFSSRFRRQQNRPPEKDSEVGFNLNISAEQIKQGKILEVGYTKSISCSHCKGVGGTSKNACSKCNGSGAIQRVEQHGNMQFASLVPCVDCKGSGTIVENPCKECSSDGYLRVEELLKFQIKEIK